ncbi:hypothetical protein V5O48_018885, partial [Marasmius crinis-equi]
MSWPNVEQDYSSNAYAQHPQQSFSSPQGSYSSQLQGYNDNTHYPTRSPNHNNSFLPNVQQNQSGFTLGNQQQHYSPNHSPNASFTNGNSFGSSLSMPSSATTFNFQPSPTQTHGFDQTPSPNTGAYNLPPLSNFNDTHNQSAQAPQHQAYYTSPINGHSQPTNKRPRPDGHFDDVLDEASEFKGEHKDNQKGKTGACQRCKTLKVRCEFKTDTDP